MARGDTRGDFIPPERPREQNLDPDTSSDGTSPLALHYWVRRPWSLRSLATPPLHGRRKPVRRQEVMRGDSNALTHRMA